jgi:hypothetical protein
MGDWFRTVVDRDASADEAARLADSIRDWLITEGIIAATPNAGCVLGGNGYPPGPAFAKAVKVPPDHQFLGLVTCGVAIVTCRTVFHAGQFGLNVFCPQCEARSAGDELWNQAVNEWFRAEGPGLLTCAQCGHTEPVAEWAYDPPWGFGHLGFEFWNWPPLSRSFVDEVRRRLGHRTVLVTGKM